MLLFSKCEDLQLINLYCKSSVLLKSNAQEKTQVKKIDFENCILEHPDIEPNRRIIPSCKQVSLSLKQNSKLIKIEELVKLELHQSTYKDNLTKLPSVLN